MHKIFLHIYLVFVIIQNEFIDCSKQNQPFILNQQAKQWLNHPHHWQYSTNEIDNSLKQLELINENGVRQYDSQSIDSVSLEVFYELSRQGRRIH